MKNGKIKKVKWNKYEANYFNYPKIMGKGTQCGSYALHAITGHPYREVKNLGKNGHWSNRVMFNYLKKYGFEIIPITLGSIAEAHSVRNNYEKPLLSKLNVILLEQACFREENTWSVIYGNQIIHSGDVDPLEPLQLINYPILAAYLIFHKEWR